MFTSIVAKELLGKAGTWLIHRIDRFDLKGKHALVTGGSRGLGLEIARRLLEKGARVTIVARDEATIDRAVEELRARATAAAVAGYSCDLRNAAATEKTLREIRSARGAVDVLVSCAGAIQVGPLDAMTEKDFRDAMELHCFAPLRLMLAVREDMRARGGGRIANISSIGGLVSVPHLLPYSTSKFALVGLSQGMHAALRKERILVSTIAPGLMRTGSPRNAGMKGDHEKEYAWFDVADSTPLLSMSSPHAAAEVVRVIEEGEAFVVLGGAARALATLGAQYPAMLARAMSVVSAILPSSKDTEEKKGKESESSVAPSAWTALSDRAAVRNNET